MTVLSKGYRVSLQGVKRPGVALTSNHLLAPGSSVVELYEYFYLPPLCACLACNATGFTFLYFSVGVPLSHLVTFLKPNYSKKYLTIQSGQKQYRFWVTVSSFG
jgi:hypothetical protein